MYHPEPYWNEVAKHIAQREQGNILAGDDEPYYNYKRNKFLSIFHKIQFKDKKVLEIGSGPGGNLIEVLRHSPRELHGIDISDEMVCLSRKFLKNQPVVIKKTNGKSILYPNQYFDLSFTSTVLQHNTDEQMLNKLINEICRVTKNDIYIFERIENSIKGNELCLGRPIEYYEKSFANYGFVLNESSFLNLQISYLVSGTIRKVFNSAKRKEGEPATAISKFIQRISLPFTSILDKNFKSKRDLAMLHFKRKL